VFALTDVTTESQFSIGQWRSFIYPVLLIPISAPGHRYRTRLYNATSGDNAFSAMALNFAF